MCSVSDKYQCEMRRSMNLHVWTQRVPIGMEPKMIQNNHFPSEALLCSLHVYCFIMFHLHKH
jgi:hypothetical protein